jgi:hypothetical protein
MISWRLPAHGVPTPAMQAGLAGKLRTRRLGLLARCRDPSPLVYRFLPKSCFPFLIQACHLHTPLTAANSVENILHNID